MGQFVGMLFISEHCADNFEWEIVCLEADGANIWQEFEIYWPMRCVPSYIEPVGLSWRKRDARRIKNILVNFMGIIFCVELERDFRWRRLMAVEHHVQHTNGIYTPFGPNIKLEGRDSEICLLTANCREKGTK